MLLYLFWVCGILGLPSSAWSTALRQSLRPRPYSVAPQHSDFNLQHHFSCAVKSDFNESRSSGQYFRLCRMRGASLSAYTAVGAITCTPIHWSTRRTQVTPARTRRARRTPIRCGQSYVFCSRLWKTAAAPPSSTTQPDCDLHRSLAAALWLSTKLALTIPRAENQEVSSLPAVLFNLALSHFSQPLHSASS